MPPRARRLMWPDINWQSIQTCSPKVNCPLYLTPNKIWRTLQNIFFLSMVMLGCRTTSEANRLKAISHLDALRINLALSEKATTLSTSGCKDAMIMLLLRVLRAIARSTEYTFTKVSLNLTRRSIMYNVKRSRKG